MKKYRIQFDDIYKYDIDTGCYVFFAKTIAYTKQELSKLRKEII